MRHVPFNPSNLEDAQKKWWDAWSENAREKTDDYLRRRENGEICTFNAGVWSDLKAWLLRNVFHGKCAYCEVKVSGGFFGDGEHYRPKGNVTVSEGGRKRRVALGSGDDHPGYFWLAYDWENLLPSCARCNNAKSDQFPVAGTYVTAPPPKTKVLESSEKPLLIHPYFDDPSRYLRFGKAGVVTAIDGNARGKTTIEVLGLDREDLMEERWTAQAQALQSMESEIGRMLTVEDVSDERAAGHMGLQAAFSQAVYDWFVERIRMLAARAEAMAQRARGVG